MAYTLELDIDTWDLQMDAAGSIITTSGDYAIAQNVANAVRLFTNDAYYDPDRGIPHFAVTLGNNYNSAVAISRITSAASDVEGVEDVSVTLEADGRELGGTVEVTTESGVTIDVEL